LAGLGVGFPPAPALVPGVPPLPLLQGFPAIPAALPTAVPPPPKPPVAAGLGATPGVEMCGDFKRGLCTRADRCKYSHGDVAVLASSAAAPGGGVGLRIEMCGDFRRGKCERGDKCKYSHGLDGSRPAAPVAVLEPWMHQEIATFISKFGLDERIHFRMTQAMQTRTSTFSDDMKCLTEVLDGARNPPGMLCIKLREIEEGTFVAKVPAKAEGSKGPILATNASAPSPPRSRRRSPSRKRRSQSRGRKRGSPSVRRKQRGSPSVKRGSGKRSRSAGGGKGKKEKVSSSPSYGRRRPKESNQRQKSRSRSRKKKERSRSKGKSHSAPRTKRKSRSRSKKR